MVLNKRVLVIGANGALGTDLMRVLDNAIPAVHKDFDICNLPQAREAVKRSQAEVVVNTAAFHRVPDCEKEYARAFEVNVIGVRNLAEICADLNIHLCHISTDYVFDGKSQRPYREDDPTSPLSMYGISKRAGEQALAAYGDHFSIVRSCGLYGKTPTRAKGGNFINTMMKLGKDLERVTVVNDERVTPTYTEDLAKGIKALLEAEGRGIFHITQSGETSWYEFAQVIFNHFSLPAKLEPIPSAQFQGIVKRPAYSILDNQKLKELTGFEMPHWKDALTRYLEDAFAFRQRDENLQPP